MSSMGKNNKDTSSYMNNRIPRKKSAASLINSGAQSIAGINSDSTSTAKKSAVATDTLSSFRIPRKTKDDKQPNNKKRTHDMSIATTTTKPPKKVKATATPRGNNADSTSLPTNDNNIPTYQIVKEGRVSGYPIIVSQVGSEHDAILLGCKATDNPQEYLDRNKDGKVKIRWKFAGYNGLVPTHTVRLKVANFTPPIRKAAVLSGLLETGNELVASKNDDIDLGEDEDDDAPILKAIRTELLDSTVRVDKDGDYNDQEDSDEKLVCYERSASVGYQGGKMGTTAAPSADVNSSSLTTNQDEVGNEEDRASSNQESENNVESSFTEFDPQVDEPEANSHKPTPSVVTSQSGIKTEDTDADSVATDPMVNGEIVPLEVKSDIVKTEGEETDDDKPKPLAVTSDMIKAELEGEETDDDDFKPSAVVSDMLVKLEDTDDELEMPTNTSTDIKEEEDTAYECDTDNDEPKPLVVKSDMDVKTEEVDTDNEMDAQQVEPDDEAEMNDEFAAELDSYALASKFFEKLNSCLQVYSLDGIKEMIKSRPYLLTTLCPSKNFSKIKKGCTAMEALCCWEEEDSQHTRGLLYDLVLLGGTATDNCYESIRKRNWRRADKPLEHYCALLLSGYYPTKGHYLDYPMSYYFLDDLAKAIERYRGEPTPDFPSMLYKTVKLGDSLGINGPIQSQLIIDNINSLPSLETGVTHSKDGPMEKLLNRFPTNRFPIDKVRDLKLDPQKQQQLAQEEEKEKMQEKRMEKEELKRKERKDRQKKEQEIELMCSVCKLSKNRNNDFFKKQRSKGANAKCKKCYEECKKGAAGERVCSACNIPKSVSKDFTKSQRGKGDKARCKDCVGANRPSSGQSYTIPTSIKETEKQAAIEKTTTETPSQIQESLKDAEQDAPQEKATAVNDNELKKASFTTRGYVGDDPWLMKDVCVYLQGKGLAIIKEVNKNNVMLEFDNKSIQQVSCEEVEMVVPQPLDKVIITRDSHHSGWIGELVCVDRMNGREDAFVKGMNDECRIFDFDVLATVQRNEGKESNHNLLEGHMMCSICNISRPCNDFSANEQRKGDKGKCKHCVGHGQVCNMCNLKKQGFPHPFILNRGVQTSCYESRTCNDCMNILKIVNERRCGRCGKKKKKDSFDVIQRKLGLAAVCICCLEEEDDESRREEITRSTERELDVYGMMKRKFERYTESGINYIEEMSATSDLVYVVTSISYGYSNFNSFMPCVHGIFTTCSKAQAAVKKAFEAVSVSYRDGKFLPNEKRISKCDFTKYLIPCVEFTCRPIFEEFDNHCAVVAINSVPIDMNVKDVLPFFDKWGDHPNVYSGQKKKRESDGQVCEGTKVYAIFEFGPQLGWRPDSYGNVRLCGVYQKRRKAISRGKRFTDFEDIEGEFEDDEDNWRKEEIDQQLARAKDVTNGLLFGGEDCSWAVALETVVLDQLKLDASQIDFGHMEFHDMEEVVFF